MIKKSGISCQVRTRGTADGPLIHAHQSFEVFHAGNYFALQNKIFLLKQIWFLLPEFFGFVTKALSQQFHKHLTHQTTFTGTRNAGNAGKDTKRERNAQFVEIISCYTAKL